MKTNKKNNNTAVEIYKANDVLPAVVTKAPDDTAKNTINISLGLIDPSNYNSRKTFGVDALRELAQSISTHGLIQPITVRKKGTRYEIICGERRFRACQLLNLAEIPVIVREATDEQAYDLSILENLQRVDVPPMEAAEAYKRLIDTKRYDIPSLAVQYGKSEKSIYQMLKLCDLISGIADLVKVGKLSASAGIAISKYDKKMLEKYQKAIKDLEELKDQGKIRMYAKIEDTGIKLYYKEIENKDTKTTEEIITNLTAKKIRNRELQAEKTASDLKELLRKNDIPQSAFTADEETAMYFFMLSKLRRCNYKAAGLKEENYYGYMTDKMKLEIASSLTEQQKTVIRRDYLHSHILEGINTVSNERGEILLAFSKQHLPEKTESIIAAYKDEYDKKNNRLDERIAELKKAQKKGKIKPKMNMAGIPEPQSKTTSISAKPEAMPIPCVG